MLLDHLLSVEFAGLDTAQSYWIAYSGGLDSHVLLHAMSQLRQQIPGLSLQAIHVHHGLNPQADRWVEHCRVVCAGLGVNFKCEYILDAPKTSESVEAWARNARYAVFAKLLPPNAVLLTAHTQDDQAETLLLQLLRGAGPKGLAAMPPQQRPLLSFTRQQLQEYALQQQLNWIEDDSNADHRFDRNFLRHRVMPVLRERWPAAAKNIARSARHCAEAAAGLDELAQMDLSHEMPQTLSLELLRKLSPARQRNVLRYWLHSLGCRLPNTQHIQRIQQDLIHSRADRQPQVSWGDWTLRRYRQALIVENAAPTKIMAMDLVWDLSSPLKLPHGLGQLCATRQINGGLSLTINPQALTVSFRRGGERCRPAGKLHSTTLKKLFQEWGVPPWRRDSIPLLYHGDELAAVIPYCICENFSANPNEISWLITLD